MHDKETAEQYARRLEGYVEGKDPIAMQREAAGVLAQLTAGVGEEKLRRRPAPQKWSVVEILAHLAEDELVSSLRYRQMIEHRGVTLMGFDQDKWATLVTTSRGMRARPWRCSGCCETPTCGC